jgi:hypothetical protein
MPFHSSTGMPVADARDDFLRAPRAQVAARAARWVAGGRRRTRVPRTLTDTAGHTAPSERASLLGFNDLVSGATGAGLTLLGGVALTAGGVVALATGAAVLVTIPAAWILRGGPGCPIVARGRLELEGTR